MVGLEEKSHWRKSSGLCTKGDPLVPMVRGVQDPCSSTGEAESGTGAGRALRDLVPAGSRLEICSFAGCMTRP
jgi:hypothetical protein